MELTSGFRTELMEQREQSDARINSAESRLKSSETQWIEPVDDELFKSPPITATAQQSDPSAALSLSLCENKFGGME